MTDTRNVDNDVPDFKSLYEPHLAHGASMTPRMAYCLWQSAVILADTWRFLFDDDLVEGCLPPIARQYASGHWLEQFIAGFDRLAERIAAGHGDTSCLAVCTAEEMALHEIIQAAEDFVDDEIIDGDALAALPDHGEDDEDFDLMRDVLFEDHDVLMLFNARFEPYVNDPALGTTHLHPQNWFKPFRDGVAPSS